MPCAVTRTPAGRAVSAVARRRRDRVARQLHVHRRRPPRPRRPQRQARGGRVAPVQRRVDNADLASRLVTDLHRDGRAAGFDATGLQRQLARRCEPRSPRRPGLKGGSPSGGGRPVRCRSVGRPRRRASERKSSPSRVRSRSVVSSACHGSAAAAVSKQGRSPDAARSVSERPRQNSGGVGKGPGPWTVTTAPSSAAATASASEAKPPGRPSTTKGSLRGDKDAGVAARGISVHRTAVPSSKPPRMNAQTAPAGHAAAGQEKAPAPNREAVRPLAPVAARQASRAAAASAAVGNRSTGVAGHEALDHAGDRVRQVRPQLADRRRRVDPVAQQLGRAVAAGKRGSSC